MYVRGSSTLFCPFCFVHDRPAPTGNCVRLIRKMAEMLFDAGSSFDSLATFAVDSNVTDMLSNASFVETVQKKEPETSDPYYALMEAIVDKVHDFYHLDSKQRRHVSKALLERHIDMHQLRTLYDEGRGASSSRPSAPPACVAHTPTGPYPVPVAGERQAKSRRLQPLQL